METQIVMNNNSKSFSDKITTQEEGSVALPGFRFHPTDEELVGFYLRRKVEKIPSLSIEQLIKQADIYKHDPWDLAKIGSFSGDIKESYFFCKRGRKYKNSVRPNRVTGSGFWKATGIDKFIYNTSGVIIGLKKSLVYYRGSAGKGTKTEWMMHEFRLPSTAKQNPMNMMATMPYVHPNNFAQEAEIWTLCRIFRRTTSYKRCAPVMKLAHIKQQQCHTTYSESAANSLDSDIVDPYHPTLNRNALGLPYIEQKLPVLDHVLDARSYPLFTGKLNSAATYDPALVFPTIGSGSWNSSRQEFFGDWDELRPVVECCIDPSHNNHV